METTAKIKYVGPHQFAEIDDLERDFSLCDIRQGDVVDVPAAVAAELVKQETWEDVSEPVVTDPPKQIPAAGQMTPSNGLSQAAVPAQVKELK